MGRFFFHSKQLTFSDIEIREKKLLVLKWTTFVLYNQPLHQSLAFFHGHFPISCRTGGNWIHFLAIFSFNLFDVRRKPSIATIAVIAKI